MRPTFADPKTDFVFKRLFGSEEHKDLLIALLNALLELDAAHRVVEVTFLPEEQRPRVAEMKHSIVDVKCRDARGVHYVVEMQVLNVEGFEKRVVYNASKAYVNQLAASQQYPSLDDVIAVSICDFVLWPASTGEPTVPLVSRWRMQEQHGGRRGLSQVQYVFLELPKLPDDRPPEGTVEELAYVFRRAEVLAEVPALLKSSEARDMLEATRAAGFSEEEWELYDRARIAEQDARGALQLARRESRDEGRVEGRREEALRGLTRRVERKLGRVLTEAERVVLEQRVGATGADEVDDALTELDGAALDAWFGGGGR